MSFRELYARNKRLTKENSTWLLLRSENVSVILSFFDDLFSDTSEVPVSQAEALLNSEIRYLRDLGLWETQSSGHYYLREWMKNGWLRELDDNLYKTDALDAAIRFTQSLDVRTSGTTASHLRVVQEATRNFVVATAPNVEDRLAILAAKKAEIEQEMNKLNAGDIEQLTDVQQREQIKEIYQLASILPADFRHVEEEIRSRNQALRIKIIQGDLSRGELLKYAMDQEDLLAQTEAGGAFESFYALLSDTHRNIEFREHIKTLLDRPSANVLTPLQRQFLSQLIRELAKESGHVFDVRRRIEEALRAYIESNEFEENKKVKQLISKLEQVAVALKDKDVDLRTETSVTLPVGSIKATSPKAIKLKVQEETINTDNIEVASNMREPSTALLANLESIDLHAMARQLKAVLDRHGPMTVKTIADHLPITKGLEELVGHIRIASALKAVQLPDKEAITIADKDGGTITVMVPTRMLSAELFPDDITDLKLEMDA